MSNPSSALPGPAPREPQEELQTVEGTIAFVSPQYAGELVARIRELASALQQAQATIQRLTQERDRLLADWREQDAQLQEICGLCDSDEFVSSGADVVVAVRETITDLRERLADSSALILPLQALVEQMRQWAEDAKARGYLESWNTWHSAATALAALLPHRAEEKKP